MDNVWWAKRVSLRLEIGRAVVFNQNFYNAIQTQITPLDFNSSFETSLEDINKRWLEFYRDSLELEDVGLQELFKILEFSKNWHMLIEYEKTNNELFEIYKNSIHSWLKENQLHLKLLSSFLNNRFIIIQMSL